MIKLRTANGHTFEIEWIGVANIDGVLRFSVINAEVSELVSIFTVPENCTTITRVFDEDERTFTGYTTFRGVQINYDNSIIVSLSKI